ncbi:hypothetical protein niasHS_010019 [Heterodera schachtii]|uniref:Uncharacterized protein n=1 Tax=Heterodera schachtii TaxID=97005 RepID=A0ABD2J3T1_HETSC
MMKTFFKCTIIPKPPVDNGCTFTDGGPENSSKKQMKLLLAMWCAGKAAALKLPVATVNRFLKSSVMMTTFTLHIHGWRATASQQALLERPTKKFHRALDVASATRTGKDNIAVTCGHECAHCIIEWLYTINKVLKCTIKPKGDEYIGCVFSDGGPLRRSRKQLKLLLVMKCAGKAAEIEFVGRSIGHTSDMKQWQDIAETILTTDNAWNARPIRRRRKSEKKLEKQRLTANGRKYAVPEPHEECTIKPKKDEYDGCTFSDGGPSQRSRKQLKLLLVMKCAGKAAEMKLVGRSFGHMSHKKDWQANAEKILTESAEWKASPIKRRRKAEKTLEKTRLSDWGVKEAIRLLKKNWKQYIKVARKVEVREGKPEMNGCSDEESNEEEEEEEMEEEKMKVRRRKKRPIGQRMKVME